MILRTSERDEIRTVAKRWKLQYPKNMQLASQEFSDSIYEKLLALDTETATAKDVADIIGNDGWIEISKCDSCSKESWNMATIGNIDTFESALACHTDEPIITLCEECLTRALLILQNPDVKDDTEEYDDMVAYYEGDE